MDDDLAQVRTLYAEHGAALLRYLQGITRHAASAEDLLQDVFVQAIRYLERLREARSPRAWLFGVARHLGINAVNRNRANCALPDGLASPEAEPESDRIQTMWKAISELPAGQREALELRIRAELSYGEIAEALQVPIGTVRSRLHSAVQTLRHTLKTVED